MNFIFDIIDLIQINYEAWDIEFKKKLICERYKEYKKYKTGTKIKKWDLIMELVVMIVARTHTVRLV